MDKQDSFEANIQDESENLLDLLIFYVEDVCDQKVKDLTQQVQTYTFVCGILICTIVFTWILNGLAWIFKYGNHSSLKNKMLLKPSIERVLNYTVEKDIEPLNTDYRDEKHRCDEGVEQKFNADLKRSYVNQNEDLYLPRWDIPKIVKEKALFWKPQSQPDYCGYDSLIDIYGDQNQTRISNIDHVLSVESLRPTSSWYTNLSSNHIQRESNFSQSDLASESFCTSDYSTARYASQGSIQRTPLSQPLKPHLEDEEEDISDISIGRESKHNLHHQDFDIVNSTRIENQNMILEDTSDESDVESKIRICSTQETSKKESSKRKSKSEGNIVSTKRIAEQDSMVHTMNMAKIGPTYLYVYMNLMYGNWDDFEYRTLVKDPSVYKSQKKIDSSELVELLKIIKKRSLHEFKKKHTLMKLENIRFAFINEKVHNQILSVIIENVNFLCKVIKHKKLPEQHKLEIYRLFFYSFCYETETQLSFDFASKIINSLIYSLSYLENSSIEYCDGLRCLHGILCSTNVEDFSGEIFDNCIKDVNSFRFERQTVLWEVLKLVLCEWLLDAETIKDINNINNLLRKKIEQLIDGYVEKDNNKFQEFILIWKMFLQTRNLRNENDSEFRFNEGKKRVTNTVNVKRKLSNIRKDYNEAKLRDVSNIV